MIGRGGGRSSHDRADARQHQRSRRSARSMLGTRSLAAPSCEQVHDVRVLPVATAADWPAVHARPLEAWRPALVHLSERLGLPEGWTRLPGGEDSTVFAVGEHVLKLVPPCNAPDAVREIDVLPAPLRRARISLLCERQARTPASDRG